MRFSTFCGRGAACSRGTGMPAWTIASICAAIRLGASPAPALPPRRQLVLLERRESGNIALNRESSENLD